MGPTHGIEVGAAGILQEMLAIRDLNSIGQGFASSLAICNDCQTVFAR